MGQIEIDNCVYKTHPKYNLYAASKDGNVINIVKQTPNKRNKTINGYIHYTVRQIGQKNQKRYYVHRFIWECYNGLYTSC